MKYRIGIASTDGKVVNQHFGKATEFYIVEADSDTKEYVYKETRTVEPVCENGDHNEEALVENINKLKDCQYLLVSRIGYRAQAIVEKEGIFPFELPGLISESVTKVLNYIEIQNLIN